MTGLLLCTLQEMYQWMLNSGKQLFMSHHEQIQLSPTEAANVELADEWLEPDELLSCHQREQQSQCKSF